MTGKRAFLEKVPILLLLILTWAVTDPDGVIAQLTLLPSSLEAAGGTGDGGGCFISTLR